jgi:hypothetical protein
MSATAETVARPMGFRSSTMKRPLQLQSLASRLTVDPDGAIRSLASMAERRALFGFEQLWFYKVQAGIVVHAQRPDWEVRLSPRRARLSGKVFDVEVVQTVEFYPGQAAGFIRRLGVKNAGQGQVRLKVFELADPTAAHFPDGSAAWGSLGVNAFNRESHVAMDEVSDPPSARVVGSYPAPSKFYMTTSRQRAQEVISSGELPEPTAGTSGQVLTVSGHELDLAPGESREITFASIYNPGKLEEALADFGRLKPGQSWKASGPEISCSDPALADAAAWALASLQGAPYSADPLDRCESLRAVSLFYPDLASKVAADVKASLRKDGSVPHSLDPSKPGLLETAVFLRAAALAAVLSQDKKQAKASYPLIKRCATFLMAAGVEARTDPSLPQGWRRKLGSGYPTGEVPEVALAAAAALEAASVAARLASKAVDAGRFLERSKLICERVRMRLLDDRGFLSLCRDTGGRLRLDETADMAVAAYRHPFMESAEQAAAHRLMEKDFDTPYGPRCVPTTNGVYFNSTYGEGQLGGVWTRAVLAHSLLCYRTGLAGMGGLSLAKVARLVGEDQLKLGGSPGEFPQWVDPDRKEAHGGSDPVAASRFLEVLLEGELGLPEGGERGTLSPARSSTLGWVLATDFWAGGPASAFVGRAGEKAHLFYSGEKLEAGSGSRFARSERIEVAQRGASAVTFYNPGQVICVGSSSGSPAKFTVSFTPRGADLARRLSTPLEEYDPGRGTWTKVGALRVSPSISFEASVGPSGWKAYRVSTG